MLEDSTFTCLKERHGISVKKIGLCLDSKTIHLTSSGKYSSNLLERLNLASYTLRKKYLCGLIENKGEY